jgi:deoxyribonuclease V
MKILHPWDVNVREAVAIQERLKHQLILEKTFWELKTVAGADVAYIKGGDKIAGAIVVLSFPGLKVLETATALGKTAFPYIPGLLSFREGPILIESFKKLRILPDLILFDGQGIAHPRRFGLASHLGLWLDLPSIGCAKTPLLRNVGFPGSRKGAIEWVRREKEEVGAVLRTKENVKPVSVSPGHRIDLLTSIEVTLTCSPKFRIPEPLRMAHQLAERTAHGT